MSARTRIILSSALLCMLGAASAPHAGVVAALVARWLVTGVEPRRADLIVVVAGGARERLVTAARLYRLAYAQSMLVTGSDDPSDDGIRRLLAWGVPEGALVRPPLPSTSTLNDAWCIREAIVLKGFKSILVVTSPYHTRRLELILRRTLADLDVEVTVTASESLYFSVDRWWADRQGWNLIPAEYLKLAWAWATVPEVAQVRRPIAVM